MKVHPLRQGHWKLLPPEGVQREVPQIIEDLGNGVAGPIALTPADVDIAVDLHQAEGVARLGCAVGRVRGQDMPGPGIGGKCVGVEDVHRLSCV